MKEPDFARVLAAAAHLQALVPDAVLVGGTAAAQRAGHRVSLDADHVLVDLTERFDVLIEALEATDGWATARVRRPVLILGNLDGVDTGIRQLIRRRPLDVEELSLAGGARLRVPTIAEMTRIKAWLALRRNATRDYIDLVALAELLGSGAARVLARLDEYYADQLGPDGRRVATQLARQLAEPAPYDRSDVDLAHYRRLAPRWRQWTAIVSACQTLAMGILDAVLAGE